MKCMGGILYKESRKSGTKNVLLEISEGTSHGDIWEKNILSMGNSKCKSPEMGACLEYLTDSNEASMFRGE